MIMSSSCSMRSCCRASILIRSDPGPGGPKLKSCDASMCARCSSPPAAAATSIHSATCTAAAATTAASLPGCLLTFLTRPAAHAHVRTGRGKVKNLGGLRHISNPQFNQCQAGVQLRIARARGAWKEIHPHLASGRTPPRVPRTATRGASGTYNPSW